MKKVWEETARHIARPVAGRVAVCGACGGRFGDIFDMSSFTTFGVYQDHSHRLIQDRALKGLQSTMPTVLRFDSGFQLRIDGLWDLTKRAKQNRDLARKEFSRAPFRRQETEPPVILHRIVHNPETGGEIHSSFTPRVGPSPRRALRRPFVRPRVDTRVMIGEYTPHELPAFAACPECDAVNRIDANALGISVAPSLTSIRRR